MEGLLEENPKFNALDKAIGKEGFKVILLLRLSPIFPFALSNYFYGVTSVDFFEYMFGTLIGFFPGTLAYVYTGTVRLCFVVVVVDGGCGGSGTVAGVVVPGAEERCSCFLLRWLGVDVQGRIFCGCYRCCHLGSAGYRSMCLTHPHSTCLGKALGANAFVLGFAAARKCSVELVWHLDTYQTTLPCFPNPPLPPPFLSLPFLCASLTHLFMHGSLCTETHSHTEKSKQLGKAMTDGAGMSLPWYGYAAGGALVAFLLKTVGEIATNAIEEMEEADTPK